MESEVSRINQGSSLAEKRIGAESQDSPEKKTRVRKWFFYAWTIIGWCAIIGLCIYLLNVLALPMSMIIWTLIFVFCLRGVVNGLEKRGVNRMVGTILAYVLMFVVIGVLLFLMFSPMSGLSEQFTNLFKGIPQYAKELSDWFASISSRYDNFIETDTFKQIVSSVQSSLSSWASNFASTAASTAVDVGTGISNTLYAVGFAFVIAFWILLELPAMGREVNRIVSPKYQDQLEFFHVTFTHILGGYIKGTLIQCLIIGVACGILFAVAGIPNAPALGVITGTLNIIPIIGPWLGGAVASITALFISPWVALIALIGTIIIQQFVYTFISPKIMQNSVDIHPALTLIAMVFGSAIGGAMSGIMGSLCGMLFAIPAMAVAKSFFIFYFERSTGRQIVSEDGFVFKGIPAIVGNADPLSDATGGASSSGKKHKFMDKLSTKLHDHESHKNDTNDKNDTNTKTNKDPKANAADDSGSQESASNTDSEEKGR